MKEPAVDGEVISKNSHYCVKVTHARPLIRLSLRGNPKAEPRSFSLFERLARAWLVVCMLWASERTPACARGAPYMPSEDKETVIHATRRWLRPAIYVLLLCGVTWNEFCALAKTIYVEVATVRFGKRGRPTNVSRTAMLTGLTRRDVRLVRRARGIRAAGGD